MDFQSQEILIIQVSDLHFGREIHPPASRQGTLRQGHGRAVPGMHPHSIAACRELENEVRTLTHRYPNAAKFLVVAGDLTVIGDDSEFALALSYLKRRISTSLHMSVGLGGAFDVTVMVPGNHDHWGGRLRPVVNQGAPGIHGVYFPSTPTQPWFFQKHRLGGKLQLQLMGMDSCGGVGLNFAARGNIPPGAEAHLSREIGAADAEATLEGRSVVRILVTHHSIASGSNLNGVLHAFSAQSRQSLISFMQINKIHCVLTGHMHASCLPSSPGPNFGAECRSGTATQSNASTNEFLAHRITLQNRVVSMGSVALVRTCGGAFQPKQPVQRVLI